MSLFGQSLFFKTYTTDNGMPQNSIFSIMQDSKGFIWLGTEAGASKFDGKFFKNYSAKDGLFSGTVRAIHEDQDGQIWFGIINGLAKFDGDKFEKVYIDSSKPEIYVYCFAESASGELFVGTRNNGLLSVRNDKINRIEFKNIKSPIYDLQFDIDGNLWIATLGDGLFKYSNGKIEQFSLKSYGFQSDSINTLYFDKSGTLWLATEKELLQYKEDKFKKVSINFDISDFQIREIIEDLENNIWLLTYGDGIKRLSDGKIYQHNTLNGFPNDYCISTLIDLRGDLWFGTRNGLVYLAAEKFELYDMQSGLSSNIVYSMLEDKYGNYWFGHEDAGVSILHKNGQFSYLNSIDGLFDNSVGSILQTSNDEYWLGTLNGITRIQGNKILGYTKDDDICGNVIIALEKDREGNVWLGGEGGISMFNGDSFKVFNSGDGFYSNWVNDIYVDREGVLWFATDNDGLYKYHDGTFSHLTMKDGLPVNAFFCATQDALGNYWFASDGGGIVQYDGNSFKVYNSENGLSSNQCYSVVSINNYLYVGTANGITRIDYTKVDQIGKDAFQIFGKENGMQKSETTQGGYLIDSKNNVWIGTHSGVVKINPNRLPSLIPPPLYITNLRILEGNTRTDTISQGILDLNYSQNNLRFDFVGIDFASPQHFLYSYKLDGISDTSWIDTKERSASYPFLPPGEYTFKVKAKNNDGIWSPTVSVIFVISPPFYATVWFSALMFIIGATAIYGFYLFKTAQVKRRNIELANTVRARTRELSEEKNKSDELLLNILPVSLVHELKTIGHVEPREFKSISILFTDFKGFTYTSSVLPADKLVNELNDIFKGFDEIIVKYGCEKLKTIGDAYMAGAGLPVETTDHAIRIVMAAKEMQQFIISRNELSAIKWEMRAGVHTGNVIAGVVGTKKFTYDIWGDTVNIASRMESSGEPGEINVSAYTYMLIRDYFRCEYRGKLDAKGKGKVDMYFVKELLEEKENELNSLILG